MLDYSIRQGVSSKQLVGRKKIQILHAFMEDAAASFAEGLDPVLSYNGIETRMIEKFGSISEPDVNWNQLHHRYQQPQETVNQFATTIIEMACKVYTTLLKTHAKTRSSKS